MGKDKAKEDVDEEKVTSLATQARRKAKPPVEKANTKATREIKEKAKTTNPRKATTAILVDQVLTHLEGDNHNVQINPHEDDHLLEKETGHFVKLSKAENALTRIVENGILDHVDSFLLENAPWATTAFSSTTKARRKAVPTLTLRQKPKEMPKQKGKVVPLI